MRGTSVSQQWPNSPLWPDGDGQAGSDDDNDIIRAQLNAIRKSVIIVTSFHLSVCHTLIILMFGNLKHHLDLR